MEDYTDWRGNPVKVGDRVLYPSMSGRSCQMTEGVVLDIWRVYRDSGWKRLKPGQEVPLHDTWSWVDNERVQTQEPCKVEWRARVQPYADSRFSRADWHAAHHVWGDQAHTYPEDDLPAPVTLTIVHNLTLLP